MKKNMLSKVLSTLLALVMVLGMLPMGAMSAYADDVPEMLVTSLTELYSGDETRAREDLEALSAAGLLDENGNMVALDIREDGERVELAALAERIANGETVGAITVNGNAAEAEQIVKISQVNAAIEIAALLDEEIDVTDEHVDNLESLLTGIADGSIDLENALQTGELSLQTEGTPAVRGVTDDLPETINLHDRDKYKYYYVYDFPSTFLGTWRYAQDDYIRLLNLTEDKKHFMIPYLNGSEYNSQKEFDIPYPEVIPSYYYYIVKNRQATPTDTPATGGRYDYINWDGAMWGVDSVRYQPTVTILLPLSSDSSLQTEIKQWIANESTACSENGNPLQMALPAPYNTGTEIPYCMTSMYFDYNSDTSANYKRPVYVVTSNDGQETPLALVARFQVDKNLQPYTRMEVMGLHMKAEDGGTASYDWSTAPKDDAGYSYFNGTAQPAASGREFAYFVGPVIIPEMYPSDDVPLQRYYTRPGTWESAQKGFIKLLDSEYADMPYQYPFDPAHPELQYDIEMRFTEDLYNILVTDGTIYLDADQDLRFCFQYSDRKIFDITGTEKYYISKNTENEYGSGYETLNYLTITPTDRAGEFVLSATQAFDANTWKYYLQFSMRVASLTGYESNKIKSSYIGAKAGDLPFLLIPKYSRTRETLTGLGTDILFSSNASSFGNVTFRTSVYALADGESTDNFSPDGRTAIHTQNDVGTPSNPMGHVTIPGDKLATAGNYAVVITTSVSGKNLSATAFIKVKQGPAKVTLDQLEAYAVVKDKLPTIGYTLTSATETAEVKYTVQPAGEAVSEMKDATGGTIPFAPGEFDGLKKAYTITVYARNTADDPWSVDSMLLTVYNTNPLKLILADVPFGEIGGSTGGIGTEAGSSLVMDNTERITDRLATAGDGSGYQVNYDDIDFETLRRDINLQEVISANYGSGTWGILSDKMNWASREKNGDLSDDVTLNYEQRAAYKDIRDYTYTSYIPTSDFLITATENKSADAPVTVTATHAATGLQTSVSVTVNTMQNRLYLFRFNPKAVTDVVYTNGAGVERKLKTDANGELAVYEPEGIKSDVVVSSTTGTGDDEVTYIGTVLNRDLVSGEQNIVKLELYPCNNLKLVPISNTTLTFLLPDGTPYTGKVILRGGVYNGGDYCPDANLYRTNSSAGGRYLRTDMEVTTDASGRTTVWFNPTEFGELTTNIRYVFEYRFEDGGYQPGYVIIDPLGNTTVESIINLKTLRGSGKVPTIVRQDYRQFLDGTTPTDYTRNVMDYTGNIGISPNFGKSELYTDVVMLGETVGTDANGYSTYVGDNATSFALYTTDGKKLTGQTDLSEAKTITKLSDLENATFFVFPFSAVPMLRSTYVMTNANLTADGITDEGDNPTPTARIKAVFTKGGLTVRTINLPFGVTNVYHQPNLNSNQGATAVGKEVRGDLRESTDIGAIFRSINVNDMIRKGFVFLGNLAGAGGDNPVNLMILPTQDPATFRIIAFIGANQRGGDEEDGVSVNFNAQDLAEDMNKFKKEMEELNKKKDDEEDSGGEGSMQFNFYGTLILEARAGVADGKWSIAFRGGNVGTNIKGKYEWGQTFFCGPYPAFISFETGFHADLEVAFGNKGAVRAMLLDAALGVSVEAFAGLGFDLSIVAIQLGIYGQIGADVNFLLLTPSNESVKTGTKLTISGEIGIKLKVKLLFISYTNKFASTGFNWTKKWNNYDQIKQYWTNQGFGQLFGTTRSGRDYTMYLFEDGSTIIEIEGRAELETRDYLELAERSWNSGKRLRGGQALTDVQTNAYPYSHPAFTDDGEMFLYVSDNNNAKKVESAVSFAVKSGDGYEDKGRVDASDSVLADLDVVASGTKTNAFAAWVKQVETPKRANKDAEVTSDELGMMFSATELYAASYNGTAWTTARLTDNYVADMSPTVASSGNKAIVAWRSMNASTMGAADADITAMFDVENNINYSIWNGTEWTAAQVAYNGNAGTVNAVDSAMLADGTAILVYTVRTGEDVTTTETFYTVIDTDGNAVTTGRLTNDNYTDTNAQVTAVNENGGYFVLGWYSEHDAGEGKNADGNAVVAHDIRLARINANGSYDIDFPESIGGTGEKGVTSDFRFSAPVNNADLTNVSIVWSQRMDSDKAEDAGKYELNAIRFFRADGVTGLTAPTNIATTDKNYTIDHFDAYTDASGAIHAIILGSDYSVIEGIGVYDSIDLDAAAGNTVTNNSDSPQNLEILDGEAISSMKLAIGTFPETAADVTADVNISEVIPGFTTPVQFTVTNTGTSVLNAVKVTVDGQEKEFTGLNLLPNRSAALLMSYSVPEGAVSDPAYTVTSSGTELGSGTLILNRPDVGISGIKLLQEHDGQRDIQVVLGNNADIPLAGSGKTVKLAFYKDPFYENMIGEEISIPAADYADIDAGTFTTVRTLNVTDIAALNADGEIPEEGLTVYARAWVDETEEPNIFNNDNFISFTGPLARNNGETLTTDTSIEVNTSETNEVTGYAVYADIRNNSMKDTNIGTPVALLLDAEGNIIAQKTFRDESLTLTKEKTESLSVAFTAEELDGKTPAAAAIGTVYTVTFSLNGGSSTEPIGPVTTDLEGHITLPATVPTPPTGAEPLFFAGWYTAATDGDPITADYTFTEDTTVFARYVTHQHDYTYTADGATITAECTADSCTLPEVDGKHVATLTITAPTLTVYGGTGDAEATVANGIDGVDTPIVVYTCGTTVLDAAPTDAGTYKASITLGTGENSATAYVEYTIAKAEPAAPTGTATYGQTLADVELPEGWTWVDSTQSVGSVGSNTFKANFAGNNNYNAASNVNVTVTVNKANNPATVEGAPEVPKGGYTVDLASYVTLNGATGEVSYAISGNAYGCSMSGSVLTSGNTGDVTVTVNITVATDDNYLALAATPITVTILNQIEQHITASDVTAIYGETGVAISASTDGDGALSYEVTSGDAVTVDNAGNLTIVHAGTAVVTVSAAETGLYLPATTTVNVTINKAKPELTNVSATAITYGDTLSDSTVTGTATNPNNSANVPGTWAFTEGETAPVVADSNTTEYSVTFTPTDTANYESATTTVKLTVNKAEPAFAAPTANELVYTGEAQALVNAGSTEDGTMLYSLDGENFFEEIPTATELGTYTVWYKVQGDANHLDSEPASLEVTIRLTICGSNDSSLALAFVENGERLYRYDVMIKNIPENFNAVGMQVFLDYDNALLTLRRVENGAVEWTHYEKNNTLLFAWAGDTPVALVNDEVLFSLVFAAPSGAAGEETALPFTANAHGAVSAVSAAEDGKVVEYVAATVDGMIRFATPVWGDANDDGIITAADAAMILRAIVGLSELNLQGAFNADVDGDLEVTAQDAVLILRYLIGLIEQFPIEAMD